MKRIMILFAAVMLTVAPILAQEEDNPKLEVSGNLLTNQRVLLQNDNQWIWNENRLTVNFDKSVGESAKFHSEIWLRNMGLPQYYSMNSLYNKGIVDPYNLEIREAYFQITGLLTKNLDMTVGRQIITWGTADKINPTDNLNPLDLEDVLDFGRHRGTEAIKFDYYLSDSYSIEAVFEPFYRPNNLPVGIFSGMMSQSLELPEGMILAGYSDSLFLPAQTLKDNMTFGAKLKGFAAGFDFSLSYIYGRDYLPQPSVVDITTLDAQGHVDVQANAVYPRQHILGFDMAGNLAGIGIWAEVAGFMPVDDIVMTTNVHTVNPITFQPMTITQDSVLQEKNKPYFKYVVGADYTFGNGIYANVQYIHGFLHERGKDNLNDYYFIHVDKSFFYDKLKISPLNGALVVSDYNDFSNNYTFVYMPEIIYKPIDDAEISLSTAIIDGKGDNLFTSMKDMDMFVLKFKYSF